MGLTESLMQEVRKHNIRVTALTPSTVATEMAKDLKLTDNPDKVMGRRYGRLIIAQLKLNRRVFIKNSSIWSTIHNQSKVKVLQSMTNSTKSH
jgi:3-oxoacyl-[acyl-carrier protein] reductase